MRRYCAVAVAIPVDGRREWTVGCTFLGRTRACRPVPLFPLTQTKISPVSP